MIDVTADELDRLSPESALATLCRRFRWLRPQAPLLSLCVDWQARAMPRPNRYFRWHLPRLLTTLELMRSALKSRQSARVLDLATYAPHAVLVEEWACREGLRAEWTRTSQNGEPAKFLLGKSAVEIATIPLDFEKPPYPCGDDSYDLVLFLETIEHLHLHPQFVLCEINRVLKPGGMLVVSTPNVCSWKKIRMLLGGVWSYDSPTFAGEWGHRYEFSPYDLRGLLKISGFSEIQEVYRDVYFDDPQGLSQELQYALMVLAQIGTAHLRSAAKLFIRRGSGMFFLYQKAHPVPPPALDKLLPI